MSAPFAIVTFRDSGPIKNEAGLRAAEKHNSRLEPLPHAEVGATRPRHLIGSGHLVRDARRLLKAAGIDPDRPRANGVLAFEAILTASPEFFERGTDDQREQRLEDWSRAQVEWATSRYGAHRIASLVLHLDEKTPHMHLVVLPLQFRTDGRCRERAARWRLVGRSISGPGRYDEVQSHYAEAMKPFGLRRGEVKGGQKHRPVRAYVAEIERAAEEAATAVAVATLAKRRVDEERAAVAASARQLSLDRERVTDAGEQLEQGRERLRREAAEAAAIQATEQDRLDAERVTLVADRLRLEADRRSLVLERELIARERSKSSKLAEAERAEATKMRLAAQAERQRAEQRAELITAHFAALGRVFKLAAAFRQRLAAVEPALSTPAMSAARDALHALNEAAGAVCAPAAERRPELLRAYASVRGRGR